MSPTRLTITSPCLCPSCTTRNPFNKAGQSSRVPDSPDSTYSCDSGVHPSPAYTISSLTSADFPSPSSPYTRTSTFVQQVQRASISPASLRNPISPLVLPSPALANKSASLVATVTPAPTNVTSPSSPSTVPDSPTTKAKQGVLTLNDAIANLPLRTIPPTAPQAPVRPPRPGTPFPEISSSSDPNWPLPPRKSSLPSAITCLPIARDLPPPPLGATVTRTAPDTYLITAPHFAELFIVERPNKKRWVLLRRTEIKLTTALTCVENGRGVFDGKLSTKTKFLVLEDGLDDPDAPGHCEGAVFEGWVEGLRGVLVSQDDVLDGFF